MLQRDTSVISLHAGADLSRANFNNADASLADFRRAKLVRPYMHFITLHWTARLV